MVAVPPEWTRGLRFVPIAMLSAVVQTSLADQANDAAIRWSPPRPRAFVVYRTGQVWVCIVARMLTH